MLNSAYSNNSQRWYDNLRLQMSMLAALLVFALLVSHTQGSADYGESSSDFQPNNSGSNSEATSGNDEIYETAMLQQDMDISEQRKKLMEAVTETDDEAEAKTHATIMSKSKMHNTRLSATVEGSAQAPGSKDSSAELSMGNIEQRSADNSNNIRSPPAVMPATAMIPTYVRQAKAEQYPRTIGGATVSAEEADVNVSLSDYVEDEEHQQHYQQRPQQLATNDNKMPMDDNIVPIAMKFYQNAGKDIMDTEDNKLQEQQPLQPLAHQQLLPEAQQRQPFQANSSDEDYYEDSRGSLENQQHDVQQQNMLIAGRTTVAPAHMLTAAAVAPGAALTPTPTYQPPHLVAAQVAVPALLPTAFNAGWPTTTGPPLAPFTTAPNTPAINSQTGEATIDKPAGVAATASPAVASRSGIHTATTATATGPASESAAAAAAAATPPPQPPPSPPVIPIQAAVTLAPAVTGAPAATTTATTLLAATTIRPAGKQGKQINLRRRLLPHEQLRNYIEDAYIRMPLAVIVDPSSEALEKTKTLWGEALRTNLNIKIVLVSLNASGIPAAFSFNNTRQFLAGLNSIKEHDGGNSFIGIVHASELVPYDSAVFISTAAIPPHTELVQDAAITLLKKRIRLYLIWYGERAISENETQEAVGGILGEVAIRSGGEILHIVGSENSQELEGSTLTIVADAFRGSQEVDIPVDTTLSSLHVKIDSAMRTATLETPNGDINLKKLVKFKSRVMSIDGDDQRLDAYVPLNKLRKSTVFKLKMIPESLIDEYTVFVRAERKADLFLDDIIKRFDTYFMQGLHTYPIRFHDTRLQSLSTSLATAGIHTHDNLRFPDAENVETNANELTSTPPENSEFQPKTEVETFSEIEVHNTPGKTTNSSNGSPKAVINANGAIGNNQRGTNILQRDVTKIEMGLQSQVLVAPGMMGQLQFEVTNTRTEPIYHNIQVVDERRFLLRLTPQSIFLRAGETATVSVTVMVPNGTPQGTIDKITFTCHGGGIASLSLNLKVITTVDAQDTTSPSLSWEFGSRCEHINADAANCAERFWTLDITAQDWQTGIMRLQTTPATGLLYRNSYTIGSTEPLKATYIATCCEPKLAITAYDIAGNQRAQSIDVRDLVLTEASIAAIVLGVLLLILLIILLIWGIVWCCRRRRVSLDLPTYRSHSTRSME